MKLPSSIRVLGRKYSVSLDRARLNEHAVDIGAKDGLYGLTDNVDMRIWLDPESGKARQQDTLLHELLHACLDATGLDKMLGEEHEEEVANRLAPVLLEVWRSNPKLVAFLLG